MSSLIQQTYDLTQAAPQALVTGQPPAPALTCIGLYCPKFTSSQGAQLSVRLFLGTPVLAGFCSALLVAAAAPAVAPTAVPSPGPLLLLAGLGTPAPLAAMASPEIVGGPAGTRLECLCCCSERSRLTDAAGPSSSNCATSAAEG